MPTDLWRSYNYKTPIKYYVNTFIREYDLSKAKKDLSKATSEVIKSSTEHESEKTVLAFKQTITKATQEAQHVTPLCAESPLVDTQDKIPSPPIFQSVNTSEIKKEEQLTKE